MLFLDEFLPCQATFKARMSFPSKHDIIVLIESLLIEGRRKVREVSYCKINEIFFKRLRYGLIGYVP